MCGCHLQMDVRDGHPPKVVLVWYVKQITVRANRIDFDEPVGAIGRRAPASPFRFDQDADAVTGSLGCGALLPGCSHRVSPKAASTLLLPSLVTTTTSNYAYLVTRCFPCF
jgi:hypothetical protein